MSVTIGGVEITNASVGVDLAEGPDETAATFFEKLCDEAGIEHRRVPWTYEATGEVTMSRASVDRLLDALTPPIRGATDAVLARRVQYGGRKGRSAWRRLRAKGFVGIVTIDGGPPHPLAPVRIELQERSAEAWKPFEEAVEHSRRVLEETLNRQVDPERLEERLAALRGAT